MGTSRPESQQQQQQQQHRQQQRTDLSRSPGPPYTLPPLRNERPSERDKRTYRACLHCRQRKSRCDLYGSGEPGKPPCERCIREQHECILGGSRRGGKRIKRTQSDTASNSEASMTSPVLNVPRSVPTIRSERSDMSSKHSETRAPYWTAMDSENQVASRPTEERETSSNVAETEDSSAKMTVREDIASADIQNPSDALEFLSNVADRAEGRMLPPIRNAMYSQSPSQQTMATTGQISSAANSVKQSPDINTIPFAPLQKGQLNLAMMTELLSRYEQHYHPFFPLANPAALDPRRLATTAMEEPHLLASICTIASKDDWNWWHIHEACSAHMQELIARLVYGGGGSVEAVEALLILSEWVPRRPQSTPSIGKGEEDHQAWMFVGTAVRLGYLLGLDRTGFRNESDSSAPDFNRKRLAWSACYMMDRHISVRIGKAFWSRGPGPMTGLNAQDFPSLRARNSEIDDYAAIWEANMELTQLFSNAHDVLYSSKNRSAQLNSGGEYVKYIDDFRTATRAWHNTWSMLTCSAPLKASMVLSYEYLRLYVNAFAYQATINRMVVQANEYAANNATTRRAPAATPFTDFMAVTPDARFIYDSVDAAKSLLNTFNAFVDPITTFRYMPLRFYLYVIYSACFLYKARSTGVLGDDKEGTLRQMINDTIERLQAASTCSNDVGDRYSKLIRLLWRKPPSQDAGGTRAMTVQPTVEHSDQGGSGAEQQQANLSSDSGGYTAAQQQVMPLGSINTFSWLDLQGVENFATSNNNGSVLDGSMDSFEDGHVQGVFAPFNPAYFTQMQQTHQQQQQQQQQQQHQQQHQQQAIWPGMVNPNIIF